MKGKRFYNFESPMKYDNLVQLKFESSVYLFFCLFVKFLSSLETISKQSVLTQNNSLFHFIVLISKIEERADQNRAIFFLSRFKTELSVWQFWCSNPNWSLQVTVLCVTGACLILLDRNEQVFQMTHSWCRRLWHKNII